MPKTRTLSAKKLKISKISKKSKNIKKEDENDDGGQKLVKVSEKADRPKHAV